MSSSVMSSTSTGSAWRRAASTSTLALSALAVFAQLRGIAGAAGAAAAAGATGAAGAAAAGVATEYTLVAAGTKASTTSQPTCGIFFG